MQVAIGVLWVLVIQQFFTRMTRLGLGGGSGSCSRVRTLFLKNQSVLWGLVPAKGTSAFFAHRPHCLSRFWHGDNTDCVPMPCPQQAVL
ncbi:hypothetical protein EI94DRAFT_1338539 [Lactarius quietus]|nr:hypothetical protein EI94DRAFT_1338539 [Lactarius quietus]